MRSAVVDEALAWAYQLCGARWPNEQAMDNLSAVQRGKIPPHEWPVVPPEDSDAVLLVHPTYCPNCGFVKMRKEPV